MREAMPKTAISVGGQGLVLNGNLAAMEAYEEASGGYDLFDCWDQLRERLLKFEETGKTKRLPTSMVLNLLWSFSATWRSQNGWNAEDVPSLEPRERTSFKRWADELTLHDFRALSPILLGLLLDVFMPPIEAGTESDEGGDRQDLEPEPVTTGT